ncbi:MAG: S-adenosylmethionine decarboxylase [Acidobacteria bacterium]|nr:S-adenosylmethionine decarboxylase [Acidobacteriota bacterium]
MGGIEWVVEAHGCEAPSLRDPQRLRALFAALIEALGLRPVGEAVWHQFPGPGGITGLVLLSESHLACHTFPEHGSLCLNLFCCRPRPEWDFETQLRRRFQAAAVRIRRIARPYDSHEPEDSQLPELRRADHLPLV